MKYAHTNTYVKTHTYVHTEWYAVDMADEHRHPYGRQRLTRSERREQTRERLLDAAAEVFNRLGYHGASMDAVAEAAGYTKGAVYSNFATKGDLFLALLTRYSMAQAKAQSEAVANLALEELGEYGGRALVDQASSQEKWDVLQIEFWLAAMRDPVLREALASGGKEIWREVGDRLDQKFTETGRDIAFTGVEFAKLVNTLGTGLLINLYIDPEFAEPELFSRAIRILLGLPARGPGKSPGRPHRQRQP